MSFVRSGSLSSMLVLLAAACGDGEPAAPSVPMMFDTPVQAADGGAPDEDQGNDEDAHSDEGGDDKQEENDPVALPCDVKEFLARNCQRCHGADAKNGTPLLTRDNLLAVAKRDAAVMVADRVLLRVAETEKPMPPAGKGERVSQKDLEMFTAWVDQGLQPGQCDQEFEISVPATPATPAMPTTPASP
jgi:mono/diheme cytochrome c family protein